MTNFVKTQTNTYASKQVKVKFRLYYTALDGKIECQDYENLVDATNDLRSAASPHALMAFNDRGTRTIIWESSKK